MKVKVLVFLCFYLIILQLSACSGTTITPEDGDDANAKKTVVAT